MTLTDAVHVDLYRFDHSLTRVVCHQSTVPRVFNWLKRCAQLRHLELIAVKHVTQASDTSPTVSWPHVTRLTAQRIAVDPLALIADTPQLRHLVLRDCALLEDTHLAQMSVKEWIRHVTHLRLIPTLFTESALSALLAQAPRLLQFECTRAVFSDQLFRTLSAQRVHLRISFADHPC